MDRQVDLRGVDYLHNWSSTIEYLQAERERLEQLLEPHVATKKTPCILEFRRRKRYLKWPSTNRLIAAAMSLSFVERALAAVEARDFEGALRFALGFAVASGEEWTASEHGISQTEALAGYLLQKQARAAGGKATTKWTPEVERLARAILAEIMRGNSSLSHDAACGHVAARLRQRHGVAVSKRTVRRHLAG